MRDQHLDFSNVEATAEQMSKPHPYEDTFTREDAWKFENVHARLARHATGEEHWARLFHEYGQCQTNRGYVDVASAWVKFAARKQVDVLAAETSAEDAAVYPA